MVYEWNYFKLFNEFFALKWQSLDRYSPIFFQ